MDPVETFEDEELSSLQVRSVCEKNGGCKYLVKVLTNGAQVPCCMKYPQSDKDFADMAAANGATIKTADNCSGPPIFKLNSLLRLVK